MFKRLLPVVLAFGTLPAHATISYYVGASAEASFQTALIGNGLTASGIINFSGATGSSLVNSVNNVGGTGVNFVGVTTTVSVTGANQLREDNPGNGARVDVTPTSPIYAIGLHFLSGSSSGNFWCFEPQGSGSCDNVLTVTSTQPAFFGIIGSSPLSSFTIRQLGSGTALLINDFTLGTLAISETPEPSTMAMLGGALVLFPLAARRKRRAS